MAIIMIDGARNSGKTHLINSFFAQNTNPNVLYYKFKFAQYIEDLDLVDQESGPGVHYFSISNVMTILELNQDILKDKVIVFDRSIFSAYVWSIYRKRMDEDRLLSEFQKILESDLYQNCVLVYLTRSGKITTSTRGKDYFDNFENYSAEETIFDNVLDRFENLIQNPKNRNSSFHFVNAFDEKSVSAFNELLNFLSSKG